MTVCNENEVIVLTGKCGVEEVEALVGYLEGSATRNVDLKDADEIHTALWQALMAFDARIVSGPQGAPTIDIILAAISHNRAELSDTEPSILRII